MSVEWGGVYFTGHQTDKREATNKLCLLFPVHLSGGMWEKAFPESGSPALNAPEPLPWGCRVNSLWRGCEASRMMLLAWLTQRFHAVCPSWGEEEGARRISSFTTGSASAAVAASPVMWCASPRTWRFLLKPTSCSLVPSTFRFSFFSLHQSTSSFASWGPCHRCPFCGPPLVLQLWRGAKHGC